MTLGGAQRRETVNEYLRCDIHSVKGWCIPQLWQTIWPLARNIGDGPIAEIGVFEGKFFIGLCKTFGTCPENRALAIDVFDMQRFNLDGAGAGNLARFKENLSSHGIDVGSVKILQTDSLSLRSHDVGALTAEHGQYKFFSIDGCHEVAHTTHDIEFAMNATAPEGIIAIDDYNNPNWPGVQEAVAKMYLLRDFAFVPLAVTCNKLLLCSYSYQKDYIELVFRNVKQCHPNTRIKQVRRFGYDTLTVQPQLDTWQDLN